MLSFVVAVSQNNVIGIDKGLPWYLPNDLMEFKKITLTESKTMIMGRKTFESLPKVLPGRKHIILTKNEDYKVDNKDVRVINSIDEIMPYVNSDKEYFVIGGEQIFNILFPYAERMYITEIHENFEGDAFFIHYDKSMWKVTSKKEGLIDEKNKYRHTFLVLERI